MIHFYIDIVHIIFLVTLYLFDVFNYSYIVFLINYANIFQTKS